jgi:hypothetical protein
MRHIEELRRLKPNQLTMEELLHMCRLTGGCGDQKQVFAGKGTLVNGVVRFDNIGKKTDGPVTVDCDNGKRYVLSLNDWLWLMSKAERRVESPQIPRLDDLKAMSLVTEID